MSQKCLASPAKVGAAFIIYHFGLVPRDLIVKFPLDITYPLLYNVITSSNSTEIHEHPY